MIPNSLILLLICLLSVKCNAKEPCSFKDSINITDGIKYPNGDIKYDDILYTPNLYGSYDYEYINKSSIKSYTEPHYRGCICLVKNCINFCCPRGQAFQTGGCFDDPLFNINEDSLSEEADLHNKYGVVYWNPCTTDGHFLQFEDSDYDDEWHLLDDGQLYLNWSKLQFNSKEQFCLTRYYPNDSSFSEDSEKYPFMAYRCENSNPKPIVDYVIKFALYPVGE